MNKRTHEFDDHAMPVVGVNSTASHSGAEAPAIPVSIWTYSRSGRIPSWQSKLKDRPSMCIKGVLVSGTCRIEIADGIDMPRLPLRATRDTVIWCLLTLVRSAGEANFRISGS
jgi:hypothetical protein